MIDQLLAEAGATAGDAPFLIAGQSSVDYRTAATRAGQVAAAIGKQGLQRFGIHARDSAELVLLICGAAAARSEICVINREYDPATIAALLRKLDLDAMVTDAPIAEPGIASIPIEQLLTAQPPAPAVPATGSDPQIIILTTGTTGEPKGARYRWANLVAQGRRKPELAGTRWLLAYPLNHFAGIQVLTHVLLNQATLVIPDSPAIADALDALERHQVAFVSATPTFWRVAIAQLGRDRARRLPIRQITLGGEAVPQDLIEMIADHFPEARVSQVFATTEAGSCFSVRDRANGIPASLLDAADHRGVRIRIVDGELQVHNPNGMIGYYGAGESGDEWRSTGDLVEQRGDRIHFVGRSSETINVGGVKVHPLPVEAIVQAVPGVAAVRCYGRRNPVTGQIVALDVEAVPGTDRAALETAIRQACGTLSRASQPRLVRFVEALETANRKILRRPS